MQFSEKIIYCRKKAGLSQEELAAQIGVSRQAVSKWETGESTPELNKLTLLAKTFQTSTDWLLSEDEPQSAAPEDAPTSSESRNYPQWFEHLPKFCLSMFKRFGWLIGIHVSVGGAMFAALGLLGKAALRSMFSSQTSPESLLPEGIPDSFFFSNAYTDYTNSVNAMNNQLLQNNPVSTICSFAIGLGVVMIVAGILLALFLRRYAKK